MASFLVGVSFKKVISLQIEWGPGVPHSMLLIEINNQVSQNHLALLCGKENQDSDDMFSVFFCFYLFLFESPVMGKVTDGLSSLVCLVCTCMYIYMDVCVPVCIYTCIKCKFSSQYSYLMILFGNVLSYFLLLLDERPQSWQFKLTL